jgi:hypothetical protein
VILVGLAVVGGIAAMVRKRPEDKIKNLFEDQRYQKAMEIFSAHLEKKEKAAQPGDQGTGVAPEDPARFQRAFEAAIQHLAGEGISKEEAERDFALMVNVLSQAHAEKS